HGRKRRASPSLFRLAPRRAARSRPLPRPAAGPIGTAPAGILAKIAAILRAAAVAFRHPVHRPRLLDRLLGANRIALLKELGEGGSDTLADRILHRLRQVGKGGVAMQA